MRRLHGARAVAAGVCIASFCGYDCVPIELGLYLGRQHPSRRRHLRPNWRRAGMGMRLWRRRRRQWG